MTEKVKLLDLPRDSKFTIVGDESKTLFTFEKVDGMFSRCFFGGDNLIHLSAWTEVEEVI